MKNYRHANLQGTVAFFHPSASGGGGGERVLWCVAKVSEANILHLPQHREIS